MTAPEAETRAKTPPSRTGRWASAARLTLGSPQKLLHGLRLVLGCMTREGRASFTRSLHAAPGHAAQLAFDYPAWRGRHLAGRARRLGPPTAADAERSQGLLSLLTTVFDTDPAWLEPLARSVLDQALATFEWVLLDNGSTRPETVALCPALARDGRVRFLRTEQNLGIAGGMRRCFEAARGRFVVPVDSDDLLTPDALQVLARFLHEHPDAALVYSDEDKLKDGRFCEPYCKPEWDPVLFGNSCYIAHLCAFRRDLGERLGVYQDAEATGSHDWDTFHRFWHAGHAPLHVPEILYSWRAHRGSCAADIGSKPYVERSHLHVLQRDLDRRADGERFELVRSPLFAGTPDWWARRRHAEAPALALIEVASATTAPSAAPGIADAVPARRRERVPEGELRRRLPDLAATLGAGAGSVRLVALAWSDVAAHDTEWPWEAIGLCERFPDTAVVGGRILGPDGSLWSAGDTFGIDGACGSADRGRSPLDPGYAAWVWKQRSVDAVAAWLCVVDAGFLRDFCAQDLPWSPRWLGAWFGAFAARQRRRVVYSPFVTASLVPTATRDAAMPAGERAELRARFAPELARRRFYPKHFGHAAPRLYLPVEEDGEPREAAATALAAELR